MSLLVVGSVALDSVETPFGKIDNAVGGSAMYFAIAASIYTKLNLVAVVGTDFAREHIDSLARRGVDLSGLQIADGATFRWAGVYDYDLNITCTLDTQLNVFANFHPKLPPGYEQSEFVFLANIDPDLQYEVLQQTQPRLSLMDTMDFWIASKRESLMRTIAAVDMVTMNESEARMFAGASSVIAAARHILSLGPKAVIIKMGEYGAVLFTNSSYFISPAYPLEEVRDPTGAGDSFAGGFMGYLASSGDLSDQSIRRAMIHGSVVASFTVEDFSVGRLATVTPDDIAARYREFQSFTFFESHRV